MSSPTVDLTIGAPGTPDVSTETETLSYDDVMAVEEEAPLVNESLVRGLLKGVGSAANTTIGRDDVEDHWKFDDDELDQLTPPLTRIINKRPKLRQAIARGDEAIIAMVLANYTGRNIAAARGAQIAEEKRNARLSAEDQRTSGGVPAEGFGSNQNQPAGRQDGGGLYQAPSGGLGQ